MIYFSISFTLFFNNLFKWNLNVVNDIGIIFIPGNPNVLATKSLTKLKPFGVFKVDGNTFSDFSPFQVRITMASIAQIQSILIS